MSAVLIQTDRRIMTKQNKNLTAVAVTDCKMNTGIEVCFGKAKYFFVADTESRMCEFAENPGLKCSESAGLKAAKFLINRGVKTVISSNFGAAVKEEFDKNNVRIVIMSDKFKYLSDIKWINNLKRK